MLIKNPNAISIYEPVFEKNKKASRRENISVAYPNGKDGEELFFDDLDIKWDKTCYFEKNNQLDIDVLVCKNNEEFMHIMIRVPLKSGMVIDITKEYINRLNKVKTVLEATKNIEPEK